MTSCAGRPGKLPADYHDADDSIEAREPWLAECHAAKVEGRVAFGEHAGEPLLRLRAELCTDVDGFSLLSDGRVLQAPD